MAARSVGSLFVNLVAKTDKFDKRLKRSQKVTTGFKGSLMSAGKQLMTFGGIAGAVSVGGVAMFIKSQLATIDLLAKTSQKLGITTEALGELHHAASLTGVTTQTFNMALQRMTRRIAEAAVGTGEAKAALIELGVSAQELNRLGPDQAFRRLADAMVRVKNQGDRVRLSMKLFDSEGVALVNTLAEGSSGLKRMAQEARDLGLVVGGKQAEQIEEFNDSMTRFKGALTGLGRILVIELVEPLEQAAKAAGGLVPILREVLRKRAGGGTNLFGLISPGIEMREHRERQRRATEDLNKRLHDKYVGDRQRTSLQTTLDPQAFGGHGPSGILKGLEDFAKTFREYSLLELIPAAAYRGRQAPGEILEGLEGFGRQMATKIREDRTAAAGGMFGRVLGGITTAMSVLNESARAGRQERVLGQRYAGLAERGTAEGWRAQHRRNEPMKEMGDTLKKQHRELLKHSNWLQEIAAKATTTALNLVSIPSV